MTGQLLDAAGRPIPPRGNGAAKDICTRCRSTETERYEGFGGHWQEVCSVCGNVVASGRKEQ